MDFAYKVPENIRKEALAREEEEFSQEAPFEDLASLPQELEKMYQEWSEAGGPDDEDDANDHHLFEHLPELIERLMNDEDVQSLMQDPNMNKIVFTVVDNPKRKEAGLMGDVGGAIGDVAKGAEGLAKNPAVDAGLLGAAGLGLMATGVGAPEGAALEGLAAADVAGAGAAAASPMVAGVPAAEAVSATAPEVAATSDVASGGGMANSIRGALGGAWNKLPPGMQQGAQMGVGMHGVNDLMGAGGGGGQQQAPPDQGLPGYISPISSNWRSEPEEGTGILIYAAKDPRLEQFREQVRASLESWANSSNDERDPNYMKPDQYAVWYALYGSATSADSVEKLVVILGAIPPQYHTQGVPQTTQVGEGGEAETTLGVPATPSPKEMSESTNINPPTMTPAGQVQQSGPEQPGKSPGNLIPGALSSVQKKIPDYLDLGLDWRLAADLSGLASGAVPDPSASGILQASPYVSGPMPQAAPFLPRGANDPTELNQNPALPVPRDAGPTNPSAAMTPAAQLTNPTAPVNQFGAVPAGAASVNSPIAPSAPVTTPTQAQLGPNTMTPNALAQGNVGPNLPSARSASTEPIEFPKRRTSP